MKNIVSGKSFTFAVASILMAILVTSIFSYAHASSATGLAGLENANAKTGFDLGRQVQFAVLDDDDDEDEDDEEDDDDDRDDREQKVKLEVDDGVVEIEVEIRTDMDEGRYDAAFSCDSPDVDKKFEDAFEVEDGEGEFKEKIALEDGTYSGCELGVGSTVIASFKTFTVEGNEDDDDEDDDRKSNGNSGKDNNKKGKGNGNGAQNKDKDDRNKNDKDDDNKGKKQDREDDDDDDDKPSKPKPVPVSIGSFELEADGVAITKRQGRDMPFEDVSLELRASLERKEGNHFRFSANGTIDLEDSGKYDIKEGHGNIILFKNIRGNAVAGLLHITGKAIPSDGDGDSSKLHIRALLLNSQDSGKTWRIIVFPAGKLGPHIRLLNMDGTLTGIDVNPAPQPSRLDHFTISAIPSPIAAGSLFNVTVTARTSNGNVLESYDGKAKITDLTGTVKPTVTPKFDDGVFRGALNITKAISSDNVTFTDESTGKSGTSNAFAVFAGQLAEVDLTPPEATVQPGGKATFTAKGLDKFGNEQSGLTFSWSLSSSDLGSIATSASQANFTASSAITSNANVTLTASIGSLSDKSTIFVTPTASQSLDHFVVSNISSPQVAGSLFPVTIRAVDSSGNTVTGYAGPAKLTDTTGSVDMTVSSGFASGIWTGNVNITKAADDVKVTAADVSTPSKKGTSNEFDVVAGALHHFSISSIANQTAGVQFSFKVTAQDAFDNKKTDFLGNVTLTTDNGVSPEGNSTLFAPNPYDFIGADNGEHTFAATMYNAKEDVTVTATGSGKSGTSNKFDVSQAAAAKVVVTPKEGMPAVGGSVVLNATSATASPGSKVVFSAEAFDEFGNEITAGSPATFTWALDPAGLGTVSASASTATAEFTAATGPLTGVIRATMGSASGTANVIVTAS